MDNYQKVHILKFRAVNKDIFDAIKLGRKKVETRAATKRYRNIKVGDRAQLVCGRQRFEKNSQKSKDFQNYFSFIEEL